MLGVGVARNEATSVREEWLCDWLWAAHTHMHTHRILLCCVAGYQPCTHTHTNTHCISPLCCCAYTYTHATHFSNLFTEYIKKTSHKYPSLLNRFSGAIKGAHLFALLFPQTISCMHILRQTILTLTLWLNAEQSSCHRPFLRLVKGGGGSGVRVMVERLF